MKFIKKSNRFQARVSLILLDWSVRESFHFLHYLRKQEIDRDIFEVIIVEYYSQVSQAICPFVDQVDTWILLEMPEKYYYHKHLMYNMGVILSRGEICVICDSDAMVKKSFIKSIITEFDKNGKIVLHIDQFRNIRKDFYPFSYPEFSDVIGRGCINNIGGKTRGLVDYNDIVHTRNYGACMCARRSDMISVGGADEHIDFLGHICGPYDMTFRLVNSGLCEVWHQTEFTYHTWHPGQGGVDNYLGPHDGRHLSTTAIDSLITGRVFPLQENENIKYLRLSNLDNVSNLVFKLNPNQIINWQKNKLHCAGSLTKSVSSRKSSCGFVLKHSQEDWVAYPKIFENPRFACFQRKIEIRAENELNLKIRLKNIIPLKLKTVILFYASIITISNFIILSKTFLQRKFSKIKQEFFVS